jgi:Fe-S-cluster-containing hydrogenase component 2/thioredoxin reductase
MSDAFHVAIIGAGPAGLSAAGRAAESDREAGRVSPSYVLLEGHGTFAKTIQKYQKGKHVMAEPGFLTLRSPMPFEAGRRESILDAWAQGLENGGINIRYHAEVTGISGSHGDFRIALAGGEEIRAENVVLSIGTQGNPRTLGVPGDEESGFVMYTLDDAEAYRDEDILVVGAGDAAIENAIALARQNRVTIINRRGEFSRAKDGNLSAILAAINDPDVSLSCLYESHVTGLDLPAAEGEPGALNLQTPGGEQRLPCHRIIARLGTIPPRRFVESCGIEISSPNADAVPDVDRHYQSNVPGLYVIGALGGYPLIKQAMNQGYEVIEFIHGRETRPADYPLLAAQFGGLPYAMDPEDVLALYQQRVPMFRRMNPLAFRELIIESRILYSEEGARQAPDDGARETRVVPAGQTLYSDGEYSSSFYTIVEGGVDLRLEKDGPWHRIGAGQFFGEMSLISGRPREGSAVVQRDSILIETPRRIMVKVMNSNEEIREGIDRVFIMRALLAAFRTRIALDELREIAAGIEPRVYEAGDVLYREGDSGEELHLIRRGRVALSRGETGHVVNQLRSGELVGQMALMGAPTRRETAVAAVRTETLPVRQAQFLRLVGGSGDYLPVLQQRLSDNLLQINAMASRSEAAQTVNFLMQEGMGEATNALLIDESLCIGCDNCERACAETHGGISRLNRREGPSQNQWHVATTCRHCELPHCMKDCPTDAIRRSADGEVFITEACIGCGNCETNCPYDAISLRYPAAKKPGLLSWLLFGTGPGPGDTDPGAGGDGDSAKVAVKCDACRELPGGHACVRACPTGAAIRIGPDRFSELVRVL